MSSPKRVELGELGNELIGIDRIEWALVLQLHGQQLQECIRQVDARIRGSG